MHCEIDNLATNLVRGAFLELYLTPKPGLVDLNDSGSHEDLSVARMEESLSVVSAYLRDLSEAVKTCADDFEEHIRIGNAAERTMLRTVGTNCHKGFIFLSGLLLAASAHAPKHDEGSMRQSVARLATLFFNSRDTGNSNGSRVRSIFSAGGVRTEAIRGLPCLFNEALPAYRQEIAFGGNRGSAVYAMLGRLMATVEDSTALHRCGMEGLETIREDGRTLQQMVAEREDFISFLSERNEVYRRKNLTMGGVADMLALSFAWLCHTGELQVS